MKVKYITEENDEINYTDYNCGYYGKGDNSVSSISRIKRGIYHPATKDWGDVIVFATHIMSPIIVLRYVKEIRLLWKVERWCLMWKIIIHLKGELFIGESRIRWHCLII